MKDDVYLFLYKKDPNYFPSIIQSRHDKLDNGIICEIICILFFFFFIYDTIFNCPAKLKILHVYA